MTDEVRHRRYPRPPIIEAVVELRFKSPVGQNRLFGELKGKLGDRYDGKERQIHTVEVSAVFDEDSISTHARRKETIRCLSSYDGLRLLGCGKHLLSVHALAPYPGWDNLREQLTEAVHALGRPIRALPLELATVRYIDVITLPAPTVTLENYFTFVPPPIPALPGPHTSLGFRRESRDPGSGILSRLDLVTVPSPTGLPNLAIRYDLTVLHPYASDVSLTEGDWLSPVEALHLMQREAFEQSITDATRELFR